MKPHLHFMGIGGIGMSALAHWYHADGYTVSGCDNAHNSQTEQLKAQGINVQIGHDPSHLNNVHTLVSTMAVSNTHPELLAAKERGVRSIKRIELLAELFQSRKAIGITGTHGKSTTTGMTASIFLHATNDPSILIGGVLPALNSNVRYGKDDALIVEVDESDPGFANLHADIAVITNLEDDHIAGDYDERRNYHASLADLEAAMLRYAKQANTVIYCADWPNLTDTLTSIPNALSYGFNDNASYKLKNLTLRGDSSSFVFCDLVGRAFEVVLRVPGEHNVLNAAAALAAADQYGIALDVAVEALGLFGGIGRRWQQWGVLGSALVIDDYAHHPTEVEATLLTARRTGRRVRAVLQPHRWVRTARTWQALADAVSLADEVLVLDIYAAGEKPIAGISSSLIVERLQRTGHTAAHYTAASALSYLAESVEANDLIITLGAGDVWQVAANLVADKQDVVSGVQRDGS